MTSQNPKLIAPLAAYLRQYHRHEIHVDGRFPDAEPALIVGNHGFGGIVDLNVFAGACALQRIGVRRPVTSLVHQIAWTAGAGWLVEAFGGKPGSKESVDAAFAAGHHVVVYPGGDVDAAKSWRDRNVVRFAGRSGFARVAMQHDVPVVPIVTAGAGESLVGITDGQRLARTLRLPRLLRVKAVPVSVSIPWGLSVGLAGMLPYLPLPTKLATAVLPAMRPRPGETAEAFAARVEQAMQQRLDGLVADRTPIIG